MSFMEEKAMNGFWRKKLPAFLLAMILAASLVTPALAADEWKKDETSHWKETTDSLGHIVKNDLAEHNYDSTLTITKEPTCFQSGAGYKTCQTCGYQVTVTIGANPDLHEIDQSAYVHDSSSHWYPCVRAGDGCTYRFEEHAHSAANSKDYVSTASGMTHWQTCATCG